MKRSDWEPSRGIEGALETALFSAFKGRSGVVKKERTAAAMGFMHNLRAQYGSLVAAAYSGELGSYGLSVEPRTNRYGTRSVIARF